jgi:hypothetical protein
MPDVIPFPPRTNPRILRLGHQAHSRTMMLNGDRTAARNFFIAVPLGIFFTNIIAANLPGEVQVTVKYAENYATSRLKAR